MGSLGNVPDWFVAPRYCEHGEVIDDYCEKCEAEESSPPAHKGDA